MDKFWNLFLSGLCWVMVVINLKILFACYKVAEGNHTEIIAAYFTANILICVITALRSFDDFKAAKKN